MGSVLSGVGGGYDFRAARQRIEELTRLYRLAKHAGDEMACWALAAQVEELEKEIAEAHASGKGRMTAVSGSGHPEKHLSNLIAPIVPQWAGERKEDNGL